MSNIEVELTDAELGAIYGAHDEELSYYRHGVHARIKEGKTFTGCITIKFKHFEVDKTFEIEPVVEKKHFRKCKDEDGEE